MLTHADKAAAVAAAAAAAAVARTSTLVVSFGCTCWWKCAFRQEKQSRSRREQEAQEISFMTWLDQVTRKKEGR